MTRTVAIPVTATIRDGRRTPSHLECKHRRARTPSRIAVTVEQVHRAEDWIRR